MNGKILGASLLAVMFLSISGVVLAQAFEDAKNVRDGESSLHRRVAIILPADGRLTDPKSGKLHQGLGLECITGNPDGISYFSPDNDLNVAINAPVSVEVSVDDNAPVRFATIRQVNHTYPNGLTSRADDAESTLRLMRNLETAKEVIRVDVTNPANGKIKAFVLKADDMKGTIKEFHSFCDFK
ncbi:hypothetical protein [Serratia ficaria]|uniref:hypothetical protein n=1 Tax=Serratia ficaria TaxID=61651 RepID=UPI00217C95F0|nr:hypothetical protein [Serratia ficaria]CAI1242719.1 Uncharacterised protein [Serratia ficaria]CAI2030829.1 Uncharacterised protein [Serratia ficaria]CAI2538018.1 Uncharacterised protein [Serratia ficaria]CAI2539789.1 Uncharacterised protein [Serratia ficaria]CAI2794314.1 Uncharacterised protein [Serratia ficaria]